MGAFGALILGLGVTYLLRSKERRYWSLGLALIFFPAGAMRYQQMMGQYASASGVFANAIVASVVGLVIGGVIDLIVRRNNAAPRSVARPSPTTPPFQSPVTQRQPEEPLPPLDQAATSRQSTVGQRGQTGLWLIALSPVIVIGLIVWLIVAASAPSQTTPSDTVASEPAPEASNCYDYGEKENWKSALPHCTIAAQKGDAESQVWLGLMYEYGWGVDKDLSEAVNWYRKSADQGDGYGQYNLGTMYEYGQGVEKDLSEAMNWYRKSADQGNENAKKRLTELQTASVQLNNDPPTLADYDGKYPWQKVNGFTVFEHPRIAAAMDRLPLNRDVKRFVLNRNVVSGGISVSQWYIEVSGCEPHNCAGKTWKLEYHINEDVARICYYNIDGPSSLNQWLPDGEPTREGDCM